MTREDYIKYQNWNAIQKKTGCGLSEAIRIYNRIMKASRSKTDFESNLKAYIKH
jgi:hypothetical protein